MVRDAHAALGGPDIIVNSAGPFTGWRFCAGMPGQNGGPVVVTGANAADFVDGKITRLWVLLDPQPTH